MQGQVRDGYSLAYQRDEITRYCTDNDIELLHIYEDKGISGAKVDEDGLTVEREGLQFMPAFGKAQNALPQQRGLPPITPDHKLTQ